MAKWRPDANKFTVKIVYDKLGRAKVTVPSTLIKVFDRPDKITFKPASGEVKVLFEKEMSELN